MTEYVVQTDLPPEYLTKVGIQIYKEWLEFALGHHALEGKTLKHPTGRYAASLKFQQLGEATVAIIADEDLAPEAAILETGHGEFDLKTKFQKGRRYPMHRGSGISGMAPAVWAQSRSAGFTGYARVGDEGWILPPMPAYSPAKILADRARQLAAEQTR